MNTAHDETNKLVLQGLVRYVRATDNSGEEVLNAKWISSRITKFEEPGTGHAVRRGDRGRKGWEGDWEIKYFEPDGNLAVMAFALNIEKHGQVRLLSSQC
jgi:hypothetical protein